MIQGIATVIITTLILAAIGQASFNLWEHGHYWISPALILAGLWLGWIVGNDADRQGYRDAWASIKARLGLQPPRG